MTQPTPYTPHHKIRLVTAASLFDGHDAAINIMRRILQASGAEIIHLGHNRLVQEIVDCAMQADTPYSCMIYGFERKNRRIFAGNFRFFVCK